MIEVRVELAIEPDSVVPEANSHWNRKDERAERCSQQNSEQRLEDVILN